MAEPARLMTVATAAAQLGLHPETLRRAIRTGTLTCYTFGGRHRIAPEHLQAYLDAMKCRARDPKAPPCDSTGEDGTSSTGKADAAADFRRGQRMNAALDKLSRTGKPGLSVVR